MSLKKFHVHSKNEKRKTKNEIMKWFPFRLLRPKKNEQSIISFLDVVNQTIVQSEDALLCLNQIES